jgi:hypothetical protein
MNDNGHGGREAVVTATAAMLRSGGIATRAQALAQVVACGYFGLSLVDLAEVIRRMTEPPACRNRPGARPVTHLAARGLARHCRFLARRGTGAACRG